MIKQFYGSRQMKCRIYFLLLCDLEVINKEENNNNNNNNEKHNKIQIVAT
jgi:hypothetical protein